jgi:hypothetical protein
VHYHLTDLGVTALLKLTPDLSFLLVTNADNAYSPSFSVATRALSRAEGYDVVLVSARSRLAE